MKNLHKMVLLIIILSNTNCSTIGIEKIKLQYQTIATTVDPVSCDSYEQMFGETDEEVEIDKNESLSKLISGFTESNEKRIDVRGKITVSYPDHQDVYCFDQFGLFYRNGKFYKNQKFWDFLSKNYIDKLDNEAIR